MSRDIFVQDIPANARTVADIPDGWMPSSLPFPRDEVIALDSLALPVRGPDRAAADAFVARLLDRLHVRAFDPGGAEESGIFGNGQS